MGAIAPVKCIKSLFQEEAAGPSREPVFPSHSTHTLRGMKTPMGGYAKLFVPRVAIPDSSIDESIDSTPPHRTVNRVAVPPPIRGPPGKFEDSSGDEDMVASLREENIALRAKLQNLEERCAEGELWQMEINDKIDVLRKGLTVKVRCLAKAMGHPELYDAPQP